jgi:hypothetical protein
MPYAVEVSFDMYSRFPVSADSGMPLASALP